MRVPRTALIVGNGLTHSLRAHAAPALEDWNPSEPLAWRDADGQPLMRHFSRFAEALRATSPSLSAFERIETTSGLASEQASIVSTEVRHFLALAYSALDQNVAQLSKGSWLAWSWSRYIDAVRNGVVLVVSFNYDLVVERMFDSLSLAYNRVGVQAERSGIPVVKPHGSIDYDSDHVVPYRTEWPVRIVARLMDTPLRRLDATERLRPRVAPELVPPNEASQLANFQWVAPGLRAFKELAPSLDQCIVVGHSYAAVDRAEVFWLLQCLQPGTRLVIANPTPPPELVRDATARGLDVVAWRSGPPRDEVPPRVINLAALQRKRRNTPPAIESSPRPTHKRRPTAAIRGNVREMYVANVVVNGFDTAFDVAPGTPIVSENVVIGSPPPYS